jgi:glutaminyl-peptide cyclotransferase
MKSVKRTTKLGLTLGVLLTLAACTQTKTTPTATADSTAQAAQSAGPTISDVPGAPPAFDEQRAWQYTKDVVAFGPRPIGSENHKKLEQYILDHLKGDDVVADTFMADTPAGQLPVRNIIARYPGTKDGIIIIGGHYDTVYSLRNAGFVGANDGGSSTAVLLELANQLRSKKRDGYTIWLLWTDGEEAIKQWESGVDSVYGVRYLAKQWQKDGTLKAIKAFLLADMIGDADLNIDRDLDSTPWLEDVVYRAATQLGYQSHFFARQIPMDDDHTPLMQLGVPCADLIDFDYGYGNVFWHTPQDTLDKLSPKSIAIVGEVILETVRMLDGSTEQAQSVPQPKVRP